MWKDRVLPLTDMTQKYPQSQIDALSSCLQTLAPLTFLSHFYINMTANIALKSLLALQVFFPVNLDPGKLALKRFLLLKPPEQEGGRAQPALPASGQFKQPFLFTGCSRWKAKAGRLSEDSCFSHQVLCCLHEEGLVWFGVGKKTFKHPEKKDMIQGDLLYCSTLLLTPVCICIYHLFIYIHLHTVLYTRGNGELQAN